ncbi:MAG: TniB family NTP-binding protein, partial [Thaumarchaeota archaeon]|nr:TniB family NTP-binding protein [Nitrososphaerota archaeon]
MEFNKRDCFVRYPAADEVLRKLEDLRTGPRRLRPQNLLLYGSGGNGKTAVLDEFVDIRKDLILTSEAGNGKTALVQEFGAHHPERSTPDMEIKPVIRTEVVSPGESRLLSAILQSLGYEDWDRGSNDSKFKRVLNGLDKCRVEVLAIDEFHNMLQGGKREYESLRVIKTISNKLGLPIVLSGTELALRVLRDDPQLLTRFDVVKLPLWEANQNYIDFLYYFESTLSLAEASHLYREEKAQPILELSRSLNPEGRQGVLA